MHKRINKLSINKLMILTIQIILMSGDFSKYILWSWKKSFF